MVCGLPSPMNQFLCPEMYGQPRYSFRSAGRVAESREAPGMCKTCRHFTFWSSLSELEILHLYHEKSGGKKKKKKAWVDSMENFPKYLSDQFQDMNVTATSSFYVYNDEKKLRLQKQFLKCFVWLLEIHCMIACFLKT